MKLETFYEFLRVAPSLRVYKYEGPAQGSSLDVDGVGNARTAFNADGINVTLVFIFGMQFSHVV